jgi:hypothetical protein
MDERPSAQLQVYRSEMTLLRPDGDAGDDPTVAHHRGWTSSCTLPKVTDRRVRPLVPYFPHHSNKKAAPSHIGYLK